MSNNRIRLTIAGLSIVVSTPEDNAYVERLAETIDQDMQAILDTSKASVTNAAILCAVNYLDRFQKANRSATNMRTQIKGYLADAANAKLLFDEEKKLSESLTAELEELKKGKDRSIEGAEATMSRAKEEIDRLLFERDGLNEKLAAAENTIRAMKEHLTRRDEEIRQLGMQRSEESEQAGSQAAYIRSLEESLSSKQDEIGRLLSELQSLGALLAADEKPAATQSGAYAMPASSPSADASYGDADDPFGSVPPLFRADALRGGRYEAEDLPNLNWTDNL